jgi:ATP-dependent RNA circularization protein (DNA/RNA ligase family)
MSEYHKIQTIYKRDLSHPKKPLIEGEWTSDEFKYLASNEWEFTEKVDGTNIRVILSGGTVTFGGRTDAAQIPAKLFARLQEAFTLEKLRVAFDSSVDAVLYGEGFGPGIQKGGGLCRDTQDFVLFDVRVGPRWYLRRNDVNNVAEKLGILSVPVIGRGTLHDAVGMAKSGITSVWGDFQSEGIVARPVVEMLDRAGNRIIAKIKCRDFARATP